MSGINQSVVLDVSRIKVEFVDQIGNTKSVSGTGFWLTKGNIDVFVTNKHNIDPTINLGVDTNFKLGRLQIELRFFVGNNPQNVTQFFEVDLTSSTVTASSNADAAIIKTPVFTTDVGAFRRGKSLTTTDLADATFHSEKVELMNVASFIGYPGTKTSQWWDQVWNLGIARLINIASVPGIPFTHPDLKTTDVTLVSGLSFSGSRGSVVILHEKSIKPGAGLSNPSYVPPKILGIMSGHWWDSEAPAMLNHTGLSYYTRSPAIIELL